MRYALLLVLALGQPRQGKPAAQTKQPTAQQRGTPDSPFVVKVAPSEPSREARDAEREHTENEERIADGTIWLARLTGLLFFATAILGGFTWKLWRSTGDLVAEAKSSTKLTVAELGRFANAAAKSAQHAEALVKLSGETARIQLRAYVRVSYVSVSQTAVKIKVTNAGQTPANAAYQISMYRGPKSEFKPRDWQATPPTLNLLPLAPGGETGSGGDMPEPSPKDLVKIAAGDPDWVFVEGMVRYTDVFGDSWFTQYGFDASFASRAELTPLTRTPELNKAT